MGLLARFRGRSERSGTQADTPVEEAPTVKELVKEAIDEAFEANRQQTRLTCWFCDRAIDESKGYSTWLGCRLHNQCVELFKDKVRPVVQAHRQAHSSFLIEGLPVFHVEGTGLVPPKPVAKTRPAKKPKVNKLIKGA